MKALERNLTGARVYPQFQVNFGRIIGRIDAVVVGDEGAVAVEAKGTLDDSRLASLDQEILRLDHHSVRQAMIDRLSMPMAFRCGASPSRTRLRRDRMAQLTT